MSGLVQTTTKHIDVQITKDFSLISLSVWLFVGDVGAVIGGNVYPYLQPLPIFCDGKLGANGWPHFCVANGEPMAPALPPF